MNPPVRPVRPASSLLASWFEEDVLGLRLFERATRPVRLTDGAFQSRGGDVSSTR
jgi:hypothetical protein